jgi:hypothetical protein
MRLVLNGLCHCFADTLDCDENQTLFGLSRLNAN